MLQKQAETHCAPPERAGAEERRAHARLIAELPLVPVFLDSLPTYVMVLNRHRQIVFANQSLLTSLGVAGCEELPDVRPGEALGCIQAAEAPNGCGTGEACSTCGVLRAILHALESGERAVEECSLSIRRAGDCDAMEFLVWATRFLVGGEPFILLAAEDMAHQKRRWVLERLFCHDLLNSLGGLLGFTMLLRQEVPAGGELAEMANTICQVSEELIEDIHQHKDLLAAEHKDLAVHPQALVPTEFLEELAQLYRANPLGAGRQIVVRDGVRVPELTTDRRLLGRVLGNLLKNALEATPPDAAVELGCRALEDRGGVELWVRNPGEMPRDVQQQLFRRSFSTKGKGRGLGTYSARLFAENYLGGEVGFRSDATLGTTFWLRLPASPPIKA